MLFKIHHTTRYLYSQPVFLEPHRVRLHPRQDRSQITDHFQLDITPSPAGCSEGLDEENNSFLLLWFEGLHESLEIKTTAEVRTTRTNPFEGILTDHAESLPLQLNAEQDTILRPCLELDDPYNPKERQAVMTLANEIQQKAEGQTLDFLGRLNAHLHQTIHKVDRRDPGIQTVHETLSTGRGACRDLAVVFISVCRHMHIPARFVSGYQQGNPDEPFRDLHAWAEVFLPGFGWRGYDPTHGLAVIDGHVAVTASALPGNTAPVTGSFRGTGASAQLDHTVTIETH